jgi:hypothetical protein
VLRPPSEKTILGQYTHKTGTCKGMFEKINERLMPVYEKHNSDATTSGPDGSRNDRYLLDIGCGDSIHI